MLDTSINTKQRSKKILDYKQKRYHVYMCFHVQRENKLY